MAEAAKRAIAYIPKLSGPSSNAREAVRELAAFVRERGWVLVEPCVEGSGRRRPELDRALARCRELRATLVVPSLAAAGRDRVFLDRVLAARVRVSAPDRPRVARTSLELLRDVARERSERLAAQSREALSRARARGVRIGSPRPEVGARRAGAVLRARADQRARELAPILQEIRLSNPGIGLRGIARVLADQRIPTPRGGRWGPSSVKAILDRLEAEG